MIKIIGEKNMATKQVNETSGFTLAEGATHVGISHNIGGTLRRFAESYTHVGIFHITRRVAFTLAEVLITLGIIGIVSAITIPTLVKKYQQMVMVNNFKKTYATLTEAYRLASIDFGHTPPRCGYWDKNPYTQQGYKATAVYDENGNIKTYKLTKDGNSISWPSDYNGPQSDCKEFGKLVLKRLKVAKECKGNAQQNGCTPNGGYNGVDTVQKKHNPNMSEAEINKAVAELGAFKTDKINIANHVIVLQGGATIIGASGSFSPHYFLLDSNGPAGPNKWGHDLHILAQRYMNNNFYNGQIIGNVIFLEGKDAIATSTMISKIRKNQKR